MSTEVGLVNALEFVEKELGSVGSASEISVEGLVVLLVTRIVGSPEKVRVGISKAIRTTTLEFDVQQEDIGQIIGKGGHTIDSIRSLARSAAGESDRDYKISVLEDDRSFNSSAPRRSRGRTR